MAAPDKLTCRQVQHLLALGPGSPLPRDLAMALARHRDACPACAGLSGEPDSADPPPAPPQASGNGRIAARRRLALRFAGVAAVLAALSSLYGDWRQDPTLVIEASAGPVFVGGQALPRGSSGQRAWRSDLVETGPGGQARLRLRELTLELGPESELLVESVLARRLRLCFGTLQLTGSGRLETGHGWLELENARVQLEASERALRVQLRAGLGRWIDARGEQELQPGVDLAVELGGGARLDLVGSPPGDDP
jgi:hypothetical protein